MTATHWRISLLGLVGMLVIVVWRSQPDQPAAEPWRCLACAVRGKRLSGSARLTLGVRIPLNQATATDLVALPRIGPVLAERIIAHRTTRGPFVNLASLAEVRGIGVKTLDRLRPYLTLDASGDVTPASVLDAGPERPRGRGD